MNARRLFVALFAVALFSIAVRETLDPDMWWHLRTGEYILEHGIPRYDPFSFTVPDHRWITHEWLSQLFMWLVYRAGGLPALILVFAGIIALTFWLVYRRSAGRPYLAAFVVLLAALASAITWGARPQMFNLLLAALFIFIVEGVRTEQMRRRSLWLIPILSVVWANLHSGYLLGIVLLATYLVGEGLALRPSFSRPTWKLLLGVTVLAFMGAALNPNGPQLWIYPFETLGSPAMQQFIQEWQAPNFRLAVFWPFALLLGLGIIGWIYGPRPPVVTELLLFLGTAAASLISARHIPLFAIVGAPIVARSWWTLLQDTRIGQALGPKKDPSRRPGPLRLLNWVLLMLALAAAAGWTVTTIASNEEAINEHFPVAAVDFLEESGLSAERGYNSYGWGGYLIWRDLPVFVDGRADVYGDDFLFYYRRTLDLASDWQAPLDEFNVRYVLLQKNRALGTLLEESEEWRAVYTDELAKIFVRVQNQ